MIFHRFVFALACLFICLSFEPVISQVSPPLLESYNFDIGNSSGVELSFHDDRLGNGGAEMRLTMQPVPGGHQIRLEVFRHVSPGTVVFALLLERVEITFLNSSGAPIRSVVLDKTLGENGLFIIGDSADGYFKNQRILRGLGSARRVVISLFGNYE
jgi:hypothetical protein